jgi:RsiW-degrading membrane proteinase PrsW (M82 family)
MARRFGEIGLAVSVQQAMVVVLLRSLSLVFCHALWSGVVAYFITLAWLTRQRAVALFAVGILAAAVLHGVYDWLLTVQPTLAVLVVGFSYLLFYAYLSKLRALSAPPPEVTVPEQPSTAPAAAVAIALSEPET